MISDLDRLKYRLEIMDSEFSWLIFKSWIFCVSVLVIGILLRVLLRVSWAVILFEWALSYGLLAEWYASRWEKLVLERIPKRFQFNAKAIPAFSTQLALVAILCLIAALILLI
ncbi:MAG: hypothetical protein ACRD33_00025 [Candidatus Acidiferrales bacterium]